MGKSWGGADVGSEGTLVTDSQPRMPLASCFLETEGSDLAEPASCRCPRGLLFWAGPGWGRSFSAGEGYPLLLLSFTKYCPFSALFRNGEAGVANGAKRRQNRWRETPRPVNHKVKRLESHSSCPSALAGSVSPTAHGAWTLGRGRGVGPSLRLCLSGLHPHEPPSVGPGTLPLTTVAYF